MAAELQGMSSEQTSQPGNEIYLMSEVQHELKAYTLKLTNLHSAIKSGHSVTVRELLVGINRSQRMQLLATSVDCYSAMDLAVQHSAPAEMISIMIETLDDETVFQLLCRVNYQGNLLIHCVAKCNDNVDMVRALVVKLGAENKMRLLRIRQQLGYTPLHLAAQYNGNAEVVSVLLEKLDTTQRLALLCMQDEYGYTAVHIAAQYHNRSPVMKALLEDLDPAQLMVVLSTRNTTYQRTPLHLAAKINANADLLKVLLTQLDTEQRMTLLGLADQDGWTPLLLAARFNKRSEIAKELMDTLGTAERMRLLCTKHKDGYTAVLLAARYNGNADVIKVLMDSLDSEQRMTLISSKRKDGRTSIHLATRYNEGAVMTALLDTICLHQKTLLLSMRNKGGDAPIDRLRDAKFLSFFKDEPTFNKGCLLNLRYRSGEKVLQTFFSVEQFPLLMSFLSQQKRLDKMTVLSAILASKAGHKDSSVTPGLIQQASELDACRSGYLTRYMMTSDKEALSLLLDYMATKMESGNHILLWEDSSDNNLLHLAASVNNLQFIKKAITCQHSQEVTHALLSKNNRGLIPYYLSTSSDVRLVLAWAETQKGCYPLITPPRMVVFYSDVDRPGFNTERDSILRICPSLSLSPLVKRNPTEDDVYRLIRESQTGDVSALIVVIMSHGDSGTVKVQDKHMKIKNILHQMNPSTLKGVPKILILQACQDVLPSVSHWDGSKTQCDASPENMNESQCTSADAMAKANPQIVAERQRMREEARPSVRHFDVSGPDMAVFAATINKQLASRNLMIPLFARNLHNSGPDEDIHEIFLRTTKELRTDVSAQVPEYRTTMRSKLCLKKAFKPSQDYKSEVKLTVSQKTRRALKLKTE